MRFTAVWCPTPKLQQAYLGLHNPTSDNRSVVGFKLGSTLSCLVIDKLRGTVFLRLLPCCGNVETAILNDRPLAFACADCGSASGASTYWRANEESRIALQQWTYDLCDAAADPLLAVLMEEAVMEKLLSVLRSLPTFSYHRGIKDEAPVRLLNEVSGSITV